jgi:hypothetical protein
MRLALRHALYSKIFRCSSKGANSSLKENKNKNQVLVHFDNEAFICVGRVCSCVQVRSGKNVVS